MKRGLVPLALAVALSFGAGTALSSPKPHVKTARAKRVARAAQVESGITIVSGAERTVSPPSGAAIDLGEEPIKSDVFTTDSVDLVCPGETVAIGGGFKAPDDSVIALIGSSPSPGVAGAWRLQVSVQWPDDRDTTWTPYVSCAA